MGMQGGVTPLFVAAKAGDIKVLDMLIAARCNVNLAEKVSRIWRVGFRH